VKKRDLATAVAIKLDEHGLSADMVELVIQATMDHLAAELARTGRLEYRDLGVFTVESYKARKLHNPKTGAIIELPARKGVSFKPGRRLMKQVSPAPPPVLEVAPTAPPPVLLTPATVLAEAAHEGPWVSLLPSPFHPNGRNPFFSGSYGMASGRILTINYSPGGWEGLVEVDGQVYDYKDQRFARLRHKVPLTHFLSKAMTFQFFPALNAREILERAPDAGPRLSIFKLLQELPDPGLIEVIGTITAIEQTHVTLAFPREGEPFFTTLQGQCTGKVGDLVQAFGRLVAGAIRLDSCHPLTLEA
jgi:nucleoid DNA-binding protein